MSTSPSTQIKRAPVQSEALSHRFEVRAERLPLALLVGGGLLLAALRFNDSFPLNGDNAVYLLLARNLVTGAPYTNAGFPWGYPLLLAPGVALFGPDHLLQAVPWLKVLSVLGFLLAIAFLYLLFRTRHSRIIAALTVGLFAVNDIALFYTNDLLTELPYLAATAGALLYWQRRIDPPQQAVGSRQQAAGGDQSAVGSRQSAVGGEPQAESAEHGTRNTQDVVRWVLAALLLVLPYYLRTIGVALLGAAPLVLAWRRRWRAAVLLAAGLALLAAPWALFSVVSDPNRNYTSAFWLRDPYHPELGRVSGAGELWERFDARVQLYSTTVLPAMLLPQPADPTGPLRQVGGVLLLGAMVAGFALRVVKRVELPEVYVVGYLIVLCAWWWNGDRFLLPVLPFLIHYVAETLTALAGLARRVLRRPWPAVVAAGLLALLLVPNLLQDRVAVAQNLQYLRGDTAAGGLTAEDRVYLDASAWLGAHTPPGSVILGRKPSITETFAGRPSELIPLIPPADYLAWLREHHIAYVLEDSYLWSVHTTDHLRPALALYAPHFTLVHEFPPPAPGDPPTRLWQFTP